MDHGALHDPLERGRGLGVLAIVDHQVRELGIDMVRDGPAQGLDVDIAGPQDSDRILIIHQ